MSRTLYMLGNWKMNHLLEDVKKFRADFKPQNCENLYCGIAPQALHMGELKGIDGLHLGAQNICDQEKGAYTGELSPASVKDFGADFTLIGHSERRTIYNENDDTINQKVHLALNMGLKVVFCIGETLEEREAGHTPDVVKVQLLEGLEGISKKQFENIVIAYEPVWAIGTGKVATPKEADDVHLFIREVITKDLSLDGQQVSVLYGGSVKPENAKELLTCPNIDGALVGGASLKPESFSELVNIARQTYLQ